MKNNIKIVSVFSISLGLMTLGCKKSFLDQTPEAAILGSNFFKTESDMQQAVNGAYASLRDMGNTDYWLFGEMRSDNTTYQYNQSERGREQREFVDEFLINAASPVIQSLWQDNYVAIARCNDVLDHIDGVKMADNTKNQYIGEVKFLRAFHYFNLVRQFGGIPLRIEATASPADAKSKGRATVDEVYKQIIADLNDAAGKLPASYPASDRGRATQGASLALLGKVYLTQKNYTDALTALRKVTALGYSLLPDYSSIFLPANKNNAESIFEIQYLGSKPELASNFLYQFAPYNSGSIVTNDPGTSLSGASGWNIPTQDLINAYEAGDVRKDASLAPGFTDGSGTFIAVPYCKKYNHGIIDRGRTDDNFPIMRYADVLLMISECLNEQAFVANGEAFDLLNQIRGRAHLAAKTSGNANPALNVASQQAFRDAIFQERKIELAFENHRWYDLVRSGNAVAVMIAHGQREMALHTTIPTGSYAVTTNNLLLPIPQREVTLDNLTQNPL